MSTADSTAQLPDLPVVPGVEIRHIAGWRGYAVGNDGSVWTCRTSSSGKFYDEWKPLKPTQGSKYGHLRVCLGSGRAKRTLQVHALVLNAFVGPCPPGMECRHYPDYSPANNRVDNLKWGTHAQNMQDMVEHGRAGRGGLSGETRADAKLTEVQVREIHELCKTRTLADVARQFGIGIPQTCWIAQGKAWKHLNLLPLGSLAANLSRKGEMNPAAKITREQAVEIRQLFATGNYSKLELGRQFGVSGTLIFKIINHELWRD